jgi:hypothetical protein
MQTRQAKFGIINHLCYSCSVDLLVKANARGSSGVPVILLASIGTVSLKLILAPFHEKYNNKKWNQEGYKTILVNTEIVIRIKKKVNQGKRVRDREKLPKKKKHVEKERRPSPAQPRKHDTVQSREEEKNDVPLARRSETASGRCPTPTPTAQVFAGDEHSTRYAHSFPSSLLPCETDHPDPHSSYLLTSASSDLAWLRLRIWSDYDLFLSGYILTSRGEDERGFQDAEGHQRREAPDPVPRQGVRCHTNKSQGSLALLDPSSPSPVAGPGFRRRVFKKN